MNIKLLSKSESPKAYTSSKRQQWPLHITPCVYSHCKNPQNAPNFSLWLGHYNPYCTALYLLSQQPSHSACYKGHYHRSRSVAENPQKYQGHCFKSALMWHKVPAPLLPLALSSHVITRVQESENEPAQEINPIGLRKLITCAVLAHKNEERLQPQACKSWSFSQ